MNWQSLTIKKQYKYALEFSNHHHSPASRNPNRGTTRRAAAKSQFTRTPAITQIDPPKDTLEPLQINTSLGVSRFRPSESSFSFSTETSSSFRKTCSSYESPYQELTERYVEGILLSCGAQRSKMTCQDGMVPFMSRLLTQNRRRIEYSAVIP